MNRITYSFYIRALHKRLDALYKEIDSQGTDAAVLYFNHRHVEQLQQELIASSHKLQLTDKQLAHFQKHIIHKNHTQLLKLEEAFVTN